MTDDALYATLLTYLLTRFSCIVAWLANFCV